MRRLVIGLVGLAALALAQTKSQTVVFASQSGTGTLTGVNLSIVAHKHAVEFTVTGGPAGCSVQVEGTLDDARAAAANWVNLSGAQTCTSSGIAWVVDKPVTGVRVNLTSLSGGTSPTVQVKYVGVQ